MEYKLRKGDPKWNEKDWVITDSYGKPILGLTDKEMYHIVGIWGEHTKEKADKKFAEYLEDASKRVDGWSDWKKELI